MRKIIQQGETLRLYLPYADIDTGEPVDPISLVCSVLAPDGTTQTITYPHADFVKEEQGSFFVRIAGTQVGTHAYAITAQVSVTDTDVRNGKFDVESKL